MLVIVPTIITGFFTIMAAWIGIIPTRENSQDGIYVPTLTYIAQTKVPATSTINVTVNSTATLGTVLQLQPTPTLTPLDTALAAAAYNETRTNAQWTPFGYTFPNYVSNGEVEMILVPAGCFQMGSTEAEVAHYLRTETTDFHEEDDFFYTELRNGYNSVCINYPFWIDRYEVTNEEFQSLNGEKDTQNPLYDNMLDHPVVFITRNEAEQFCQQRGGRLPTEKEWEYAARGPDSLIYPWGNNFPDLVNDTNYFSYWDNVVDTTMSNPVGSYPLGASWVGAEDMIGNVWEWTSSNLSVYPNEDNSSGIPIVRGNSFDLTESYAEWFRAAVRGRAERVGISKNTLGFRCVRDVGNEG